MKCPLCESWDTAGFFEKVDPKHGPRKYYKCSDCLLVFLPPSAHLGSEDEKNRYDQHQNNPKNAGYVQSLQKLVRPLCAGLKPKSCGLDFGCGPQSVLKLLFEELGHSVDLYDPYYFPDENILRNHYDFVACTEVVEHFYSPAKEFTLLIHLLKDRGSRLGIMTQFLEEQQNFQDWWYHNDPTHVCFYHKETFQWIANWHHLTVKFPDDNVIIFNR